MTHIEFARAAAYLSKKIYGWAGDALGLDPNTPMSRQSIQRFLDAVRERLDDIEQME